MLYQSLVWATAGPNSLPIHPVTDPSILTDDIAPVYAEWVQTAIMLGRKLLVQQWKSAHAPPITDWYNALTTVAASGQVRLVLL